MPTLACATNPAHQVAWRRRIVSVSPRVVESFERVLTDRLEQPVPGAGWGGVGDDERLVDELAEAVEHIEGLDPVAAATDFGGVEGEPTREDPEAVEELPFAWCEQVIGPVDGLAQGLVTFHRGARPRR